MKKGKGKWKGKWKREGRINRNILKEGKRGRKSEKKKGRWR